MQKLVISSQFMGVKPCEIKLNRFLLLIGEQASGKSTIAKLIFFFQVLPDAIMDNTRLSVARGEKFDFSKNVGLVVRDKFYETFGSTFHHSTNFDITFYFDNNEFIRVRRKADGRAYSEYSSKLELDLKRIIINFSQSWRSSTFDNKEEEIIVRSNFLRDINSSFSRTNTDYNYLIAGRCTVVGFPEIFEGKVKYDIEKLVEDEIKQQKLERKRRVGNERLLLNFVEWSETIRNFFKNNGGSFESASQSLEERNKLRILADIFYKILKGQYNNDTFGEFIKINDTEKVFLKDASNGQQEVLRILQGIFISVGLRNRREFFVVEEPEAHLYPLAQKELINAFAVFLNTIQQGKLIITTHSPYILACINILLFANYASNELSNESEIINIVPKEYWLDSNFFSAYSLGQSEDYCVNIKDSETGLIDENYLDTISEQLGMIHSELYNLLLEQV